MLICDEKNRSIIIDHINNSDDLLPITSKYFWGLNLDILEFKLEPLYYSQSTICKSMLLDINGYKCILPSHWFVLVYDEDTTQLDVVEIEDLSTSTFTVFSYGYNESRVAPIDIKTIDYRHNYKNISPLINKNQMLCHLIDKYTWIVISPFDSNKYIKDKLIGDII